MLYSSKYTWSFYLMIAECQEGGFGSVSAVRAAAKETQMQESWHAADMDNES